MAICKFCGIPFSSVSSVCDHLELYHDDSHDTCPGKYNFYEENKDLKIKKNNYLSIR